MFSTGHLKGRITPILNIVIMSVSMSQENYLTINIATPDPEGTLEQYVRGLHRLIHLAAQHNPDLAFEERDHEAIQVGNEIIEKLNLSAEPTQIFSVGCRCTDKEEE